ncbi:MAG: helix-turn-helix domain-containing protein, partial [Acidobacteriaceae bacterium]
DAHRLVTDPVRKKNPGIGDRVTEVSLPEVTFTELKDLFLSNDFARTRPRHHKEQPAVDFIQVAREEGANIIQDFHENMTVRAGKLYAIIADVCAFANTNGGTLYIGLNSEPKKPVLGIQNPEQAINQLDKEISSRITPPLQYTIDVQETAGKKVLRILIPRGDDPPYAVDDNKVYVRDEAETGLAVRDEIVSLVLRSGGIQQANPVKPEIEKQPALTGAAPLTMVAERDGETPPRTGVEVVKVEEREGISYYTMRDLRNGNEVKNVTRVSARRLWHYAITEFDQLPADLSKAKIQWQGNVGLLGIQRQGKNVRYNLVQRTPKGYHLYFGVTEDGIHGHWKALVGGDEE